MRDYTELADVARVAAQQASAYIRSAKRPPAGPEWSAKGRLDYVTEVDRRSEQVIAEALTRAVPGSAVLGEELSSAPSAAPRRGGGVLWVVDPLDGTTNYLHGYPQYAVSIAALVEDVLAVGVVLDVERNVMHYATAGGGAWSDGERLAVSSVSEPSHALIGTGFPFRTPSLLPRYLRQFTAVSAATSGIRRAGSAALDLVDVARGRFEGFWELDLAPWDVAAGALMVREAGGIVTDLESAPEVVSQGAKIAGNPAIHAWLVKLLRTC